MTMELVRTDSRGRAYVRISKRVKKVIFEDFDTSELTEYDLFHGRLPASGSGAAAMPDLVPRKLYEEMVRRQMKRVDQEFAASMADAVKRLGEIARDRNVDESVQLRAIDMILDRVMGKPTQKSQVEIGGVTSPDDPVARLIEAVTIDRQGITAAEDDPNIVDAEVLDDDGWDPTEDWA